MAYSFQLAGSVDRREGGEAFEAAFLAPVKIGNGFARDGRVSTQSVAVFAIRTNAAVAGANHEG